MYKVQWGYYNLCYLGPKAELIKKSTDIKKALQLGYKAL